MAKRKLTRADKEAINQVANGLVIRGVANNAMGDRKEAYLAHMRQKCPDVFFYMDALDKEYDKAMDEWRELVNDDGLWGCDD